MLVAANFHYVRPQFDYAYEGIHGLTTEEFARQIDVLASAAPFVGTTEIMAAIRGDKLLPERCWLITFDDGLREQYEFAWPILQERGIPAIFYVTTDSIENRRLAPVHKIHLLRASVPPAEVLTAINHHVQRLGLNPSGVDAERAARQYPYDNPEAAQLKYMLNFGLSFADLDPLVDACFKDLLDWDEAKVADDLYMSMDQLLSLAEVDCLGTHAHEHVPLGLLSREEVTHQVRTSLDLLSSWTGRRISTLSYPYGSLEACSAGAGAVARNEGVEFALTMERGGNSGLDVPMFLARCACNDLPGGTSARWTLDRVFSEIPTATWHRSRAN